MMYKAVLFALDGAWVTDYRGNKTIQEVWDRIDDQGSRWFFYPISFVTIDNRKNYTTQDQRIVDAPEILDFLKGRTIKEVKEFIQKNQEEIYNIWRINGG
jgi:hypothetical protein